MNKKTKSSKNIQYNFYLFNDIEQTIRSMSIIFKLIELIQIIILYVRAIYTIHICGHMHMPFSF